MVCQHSSVPCTVHGGKTDPLHFPDLAVCEAVRTSSEHLADVEECDKLSTAQQLQRLSWKTSSGDELGG